MVSWYEAWWALLFLLPFLAVAGGVLVAGYFAYRARLEREHAPVEELMATGPDPIEEIEQANDELEALAQQASASLARTREAIEHGVRG